MSLPTKLKIDIPGGRRFVAAEVLFDHLARALRGVDLTANTTVLVQADGSIDLDDGEEIINAYRPPRRLVDPGPRAAQQLKLEV